MRPFHIILAFCAGLFTGYLFFDNDPGINAPVTEPTKEASVSLRRIDTIKTNAESVLQKRNTLLAGQLLLANSQLNESRATLSKERQKVNLIQASLLNDTSSCTDSAVFKRLSLQIDTLNAATDSLICNYESKIYLAESTVAVRDSQLVICNTAYRQVQSLVQEQAARERELTDQLKTVLKQQRKKNIRNRSLAVGLLFFSGFTTSMIIKSKQ